MMNHELTYWVALAHTPKMWTARKNEVVAYCFRQGKTIIDFFMSESFLGMELTAQETELLRQSKIELANYAFLTEELLNQGFDIIPVISKEYSPTLKGNLKYNSPIILYTKGNKQILQEQSIAIVGSRNANDRSLQFTDNVAQKASEECKVVVSGFAKGVDKQALDSAIARKGKSIIVLPQGITTFGSGIKKYYKQIIEGDVLVLSTFQPKLSWSVELAMARNSIIYGLASEIFVAQSDDTGGTWSGVTEGLKKGRRVYVRQPEKTEKCANMTLLSMGASPVDIEGNLILSTASPHNEEIVQKHFNSVSSNESIESDIVGLLKEKAYSSKEIIAKLNLTGYSTQKITSILSRINKINRVKDGKLVKYYIPTSNQVGQLSLSL